MKPCKKCNNKRFGSSALCRNHFYEHEREKKAKKAAKKLTTKKHEKSERKKWHRKTWKLMSEYVRSKDADFAGYVTCYTCLVKKPWREMHAAHFHHGKLDLDERNLRPCCERCNFYLSGNLGVYALNLAAEHGEPWVRKLIADAEQHPGYTLEDIKQKHEELKLWIGQKKS